MGMPTPSNGHMPIMRNRGEHMADTIELLEAMGRDASLRHASIVELTHTLERIHTPEALAAAVASGDRMRLSSEFGGKPMESPQSIQSPWRQDDEPAQDDSSHLSHLPPTPGHDKPPPR